VSLFFVAVGAVMIGIGVRQLQVGTERIVGKRFEFEDFAFRGRPWDRRTVVRWLATTEIAGGLLAVVIGLANMNG
jgi:hypothetical protein